MLVTGGIQSYSPENGIKSISNKNNHGYDNSSAFQMNSAKIAAL